jgi:hypothetical protein
MIGNFGTKPVQGAPFKKFRDEIMGVIPAKYPGPGKANLLNSKSDKEKCKPTKGKKVSLVPSSKKRHHRSVLGAV